MGLKDDDETALDRELRERGVAIESDGEARMRWDHGETIYAFHEMGGEPTEVRSRDQLEAYSADQLLAAPWKRRDVASVAPEDVAAQLDARRKRVSDLLEGLRVAESTGMGLTLEDRYELRQAQRDLEDFVEANATHLAVGAPAAGAADATRPSVDVSSTPSPKG